MGCSVSTPSPWMGAVTPAARIQTAIELLDGIIRAARENGPPADRLLAEGFRQRRYAG